MSTHKHWFYETYLVKIFEKKEEEIVILLLFKMAKIQIIEKYLFIYRFTVLVYMLLWWFESMIRFNRLNKIWLIMFTHWTTSMQIVDLFYKFYLHKKIIQQKQMIENERKKNEIKTTDNNQQIDDKEKKNSKIIIINKSIKYAEEQSVLTKLTFSSTILITLLFWVLVYPIKLKRDPNYVIELGEIHAHGINLLVCIIEIIYFFLLNKQNLHNERFQLNISLKSYKKAFICLQFYILSYCSFSYIYWLFDKKNNVIYDSLNFNNPKKAFLITGLIFFILSPLFTFLSFLVEFLLKHLFIRQFAKKIQ